MKDLKDKLIAGTFVLAIIGLWIYLIYKHLSESSRQSNYLFYAIVAIIAYITIIAISTLEKGKPESKSNAYDIFTLGLKIKVNLLYVYIGLFFGLPVLLFVLGICLTFINNFYFLLALYLLITLIMFLNSSKKKLVNVLVAFVLGVVLYFGFKAKDIFRLNVSVEYDREIIYKN